jgi:CDP-diacylglycerol--glycerol-3-phosphate 3-phosphatidyltransferase
LDSKYYNKVNAITISRILLTVVGVLLIFSGNIKLLIIAYVIMSLSEVSDIIDGYVARRDKLVTDLGKILDPLSDSISRFFYFFALAYHGLFPIWFIVFFFFRDIIVAYVRIFASFSGTVMGARFSGKLKGGVQFGGQYLLMYSLMINTIQDNGSVSGKFLLYSLLTGVILNLLVVYIFRIRGGLLYTILALMVALSAMMFSLLYIDFRISYLVTFLISFLVIGVTLYSLVDYLFSLGASEKKLYNYLCSIGLIGMMFFISPYFLDLVKNKVESNAETVKWKSYNIINIEKSDNLKIVGITSMDNRIIIAATKKNELSRLYVYNGINNDQILEFYCDFPPHIANVKDIEQIGSNIYVIDDNLNKVIEISKDSLMLSQMIVITNEYSTGFSSSSTLGAVKFNSVNYLLINDYIYSGHLYFCSTQSLEEETDLASQANFKIKSEFYIKNLFSKNGNLYMIANKIGKDLIYSVDIQKAIFAGGIQSGISRIVVAPDSDLKGISLINGRMITYGSRNKKIFVEDK